MIVARFTLGLSLCLLCISLSVEADSLLQITDHPSTGSNDFVLVEKKAAADIWVDPADAKVVQIAAGDLASDIERVTNVKPTVQQIGSGAPAKPAILIGTVGHSKLIDQLVGAGKLDVSAIKNQWESYVITTVQNPLPGVASGLVIAGSDRRGTAYGVFTLSEAIGVSPWYWWADVVPAHRESLAVIAGSLVQGSPSVKYRGVFINDEDWSLQPWAAKTFEPETHDIGPKTYAKFFELILRLKGNYVWPAMHPCTKAFNLYPENKQVADDYAIVMGSSHCEQMLRNNVTEFDEKVRGPWDYDKNRDNILTYWQQRLEENGKFENIYTIGMRGIHDSGMPGGGDTTQKVARLQHIIDDQRDLFAKYVNPDPAQVPQIFCPYKEVLQLYQNGLKVPADVTIVWPDDNYGYIRQLPNQEEQKRSGGSGIYYHVSYWGVPADYLWLGTTPPSLIWEEMTKAYDYNARQVWVLNIGGLKKSEVEMDFFLHLAWDIHYGSPSSGKQGLVPLAFSQKDVLRQFAEREFGVDHAEQISSILDEYYRLNLAAKPEHLFLKRTNFSFESYGEAQTRLARFAKLVQETNDLCSKIPPQLQDAFYELVVYPVRGSALRNQAALNAQRYHELLAQNPAEAEFYAIRARQAFTQLGEETQHYDEGIAHGKWKNAVFSNPRHLTQWNDAGVPPGSDSSQPLDQVTAPDTITPLPSTPPETKDWIERDGVISIPADEPTRTTNRGGGEWEIIGGLSRSLHFNSISFLPPTQTSVPLDQIKSAAPSLEYDFELTSHPDTAEVIVHALPTLAVSPERDLRYAVAIDDEAPQVVSINTQAEQGDTWSGNVVRAAALGHSQHSIHGTDPKHTIRVWALDPGLVLEKIVLNLGGLKTSLQGPPETPR